MQGYQTQLRKLFIENRRLGHSDFKAICPGGMVITLFGDIVDRLEEGEEAVFIPSDKTVVILGVNNMRRAYKWEAEGRFIT